MTDHPNIQARAETSPARDSRGGDDLPRTASAPPSDAAPPRRQYARGRPRQYDHDAVLNMWAAGAQDGDIAAAFGMSQQNVWKIVVAARRRGDPRGKHHGQTRKPSPLTAEARKRGMAPSVLRNALIRIIVADNLFDAVLGEPGETV